MNIETMNQQNLHRATQSQLPPNSKRCPRCGELLFEDMDVCYGCLYDFTRQPYHIPEGMLDAPCFSERRDVPEPLPELDEPSGLDVPPTKELPVSPGPVQIPTLTPKPTYPNSAVSEHRGPSQGFHVYLSTHELQLGMPLPEKGLMFGSAPDNNVVLQDQSIAPHHAVFMPRANDVIGIGLVSGAIKEASSAAVSDCMLLQDGDCVSLGGLTLRIAI